jgi:hypothetical protein
LIEPMLMRRARLFWMGSAAQKISNPGEREGRKLRDATSLAHFCGQRYDFNDEDLGDQSK